MRDKNGSRGVEMMLGERQEKSQGECDKDIHKNRLHDSDCFEILLFGQIQSAVEHHCIVSARPVGKL